MIGDEDDLEALRHQERLENVAHDVDGRFLVGLDLLPYDRILEHAELGAVELARHFHRTSGVHHDHVTSRQHPQLLRSCIRQTQSTIRRTDQQKR